MVDVVSKRHKIVDPLGCDFDAPTTVVFEPFVFGVEAPFFDLLPAMI